MESKETYPTLNDSMAFMGKWTSDILQAICEQRPHLLNTKLKLPTSGKDTTLFIALFFTLGMNIELIKFISTQENKNEPFKFDFDSINQQLATIKDKKNESTT